MTKCLVIRQRDTMLREKVTYLREQASHQFVRLKNDRISYQIDAKNLVSNKNDNYRFSRITEMLQGKENNELDGIVNKIFTDQDGNKSNQASVKPPATKQNNFSSKNLLPENFQDDISPNSQLTKGFSFKQESNNSPEDRENMRERKRNDRGRSPTPERLTNNARLTNLDKYIDTIIGDNEELQVLNQLESLSKTKSKDDHRKKSKIFEGQRQREQTRLKS